MLCWDSSKRLTAEQALSSRFFKVGYFASGGPVNPSSLIVRGKQPSENQERSCESLSCCFQYNTNLPRPTLSPQFQIQQAKESTEPFVEDSSTEKDLLEQHNSLVHKHKRVQSAPISRLEASAVPLRSPPSSSSPNPNLNLNLNPNPSPNPSFNPNPNPNFNPNPNPPSSSSSSSNATATTTLDPNPDSNPNINQLSPRSPSVLSETVVCPTDPMRAVETPECNLSKTYLPEDFRTPPSVNMRSVSNDGRRSNPPLLTSTPKLPTSVQGSPHPHFTHPPLFEDVYGSAPSPENLLSPQPIPLSYKEYYFPLGCRTASIFSPLAARSGVDNAVGPIRKGKIKEKSFSSLLLTSPLSRPSFNPTLSHSHVCKQTNCISSW